MDVIRGITPYVTGASPALGGSGDPSPATAYGLFHALRAVAAWLWGSPALEGKTVAVSGLGKVGAAFVGHLVDAGCAVRVADVDGAAVERVRAATNGAVEVADPATVHASECDVFAPCALGGVLDAQTIAALRAHAVVGAANNQLATPGAAAQLAAAGVLYAPDYVVNAGGVINLADEVAGYDAERARARIEGIFDTVTAVLDRAGAEGITPAAAADRMAEERLAAAPRR
jgi:valine dehydrogenase (NAD+)